MESESPERQLAQMLSGYWVTQAVYVAAKLGLADLLKDGPLSFEELAAQAGAHPRSLYRLLRALASLGVFAEESDGRFALTPLAERLRSDVAGSQRSFALMLGEEHYQAWGELLYSVQTGEIGFDRVFEQPIFEYLAEHPDKGQIFDDAMTGIHGRETAEVLSAYDFGQFGTVADIGGGNGSQLTAILQANAEVRGILFDRPEVIGRSIPRLQEAGVADRCDAVGGNFFDSVPAGADAYLLRHIIHDWDDDNALTILTNCRGAMRDGGKVLVVESVIPPGNEPFFGKLLDLTMLVIPGGMERTEAQYRGLFEEAGLRLAQVVATRGEVSVLEAVAAD